MMTWSGEDWINLATSTLVFPCSDNYKFCSEPKLGTRQRCRDNGTMFSGHKVVGYFIITIFNMATRNQKPLIFFLSLKLVYVVTLSFSRIWNNCRVPSSVKTTRSICWTIFNHQKHLFETSLRFIKLFFKISFFISILTLTLVPFTPTISSPDSSVPSLAAGVLSKIWEKDDIYCRLCILK